MAKAELENGKLLCAADRSKKEEEQFQVSMPIDPMTKGIVGLNEVLRNVRKLLRWRQPR